MGNKPSDSSESSSTDDYAEIDEMRVRTTAGGFGGRMEGDDEENDTMEPFSRPSDTTDNGIWSPPIIDQLYRASDLTSLVSKLPKEEKTYKIWSQRQSLQQYFEGRYSRGETSIGETQFTEALTKWDLDEEEIHRLFVLFDTGGCGRIDIPSAMVALNSNSLDFNSLMDGLPMSMGLFRRCNLMPGFGDFYCDAVDENYERNVERFMDEAKLRSEDFPYLPDPSLDSIFRLRMYVLKQWLQCGKLRSFYENSTNSTTAAVNTNPADEETTTSEWPRPSTTSIQFPVSELLDKNLDGGKSSGGDGTVKIYESVDVSSNKKDADKLTDGNPNTFWQSDDAPGVHHIDVKLKRCVKLTKLSLRISATDRNFMPKMITISTGPDLGHLCPVSLSTIEIPSDFDGARKLLDSNDQVDQFIRLHIRRCHGDGCDTRVRGIEIEGYRLRDGDQQEVPNLEEAGIVWYLNILTSTVESCLPIAPTLKGMIIGHSNCFIRHLSPLSLVRIRSSSGGRRSCLLAPSVLDAAEEALQRILCIGGDEEESLADGLRILSSIVMARLDPNSVLRLVRQLIITHTSLPRYMVKKLRQNMESAMTSLFVAHSKKLDCGMVWSDGGPAVGFLCNALEGEFSVPAEQSVLNIGVQSPKEFSTMMVTRVTLKVNPDPTAESISIFVYAVADGPSLHAAKGHSGTAAATIEAESGVATTTQTECRRVELKLIGRLILTDREEMNKDLDIYLEPCPSKYVSIQCRVTRNNAEVKEGHFTTLGPISFYGFAGHRAVGTLSPIWSEVYDVENPNLELACRFMLFASLIDSIGYDFHVGHLANGLSANRSDLDWALVESTFKIVSNNLASDWTVKLTFLHFIANLFRLNASPGTTSCPPTLSQGIWKLLIDLSTRSGDEDPAKQEPEIALRLMTGIINDGIKIFYPTEDSRRETFLSLISASGKWRDGESIDKVTFAALCKCFNGNDGSEQLIHLPWRQVTRDDQDRLVHLQTTFSTLFGGYVALCIDDLKTLLNGSPMPDCTNSALLGAVINAQLLYLFRWYTEQKQLANTMKMQSADMIVFDQYREIIDTVVTDTVSLSLYDLRKLFDFILLQMDETDERCSNIAVILSASCTVLGTAFNSVYQLAMAAWDTQLKGSVAKLMKRWFSLVNEPRLKKLIIAALDGTLTEKRKQLETCNSEHLTTLYRWTGVESSHPYPSPSQFNNYFHQPGALVFRVLDSKCQIDPPDHATFITNTGRKIDLNTGLRDQKHGTRPLDIRSTGHLKLAFKSDIRTSNKKQWGYRFSISAEGIPSPVFTSWAADLFLTLAQFGGLVFAAGISNTGVNGNLNEVLEIGTKTLDHFKSVDKSEKEPASTFCLAFLRPALDVFAKNVEGGTACTEESAQKNLAFWYAVADCSKSLAGKADKDFWLLNILHLFPWRCLSSPIFDHDKVFPIIQRELTPVIDGSEESLKTRPTELRNEIIDAECYGLFRTWLTMLQPESQRHRSIVSTMEFKVWQSVNWASSDEAQRRQAKLFVSQYADLLGHSVMCDGCGHQVAGARYRCLECENMDLCTSCLSVGNWPIMHGSDHRLVEFSFKCNGCCGYIIGSRFHCTVCKDYDLCFGCMFLNRREENEEEEEVAEEEEEECQVHKHRHPVHTFPPTVHQGKDCETQTIHDYAVQLAWIFLRRFACSFIRLSSVQTIDPSDQPSIRAGHCDSLVRFLLEIAKKRSPSSAAVRNEDRLPHLDVQSIWNNHVNAMEEEHRELLMGLLAFTLTIGGDGYEALIFVFDVLKSRTGQGSPHANQLALNLLGKLCSITDPTMADRAMNECSSNPVDGYQPGYLTCQFLFAFGSTSLQMQQLHLAATVAWIIQRLWKNPMWAPAITDYVQSKMGDNPSHVDMVYAYLIHSGFPTVFWRGASVEYQDERGKRKCAVVIEAIETGIFRIMTSGRHYRLIKANDIVLPVKPLDGPSKDTEWDGGSRGSGLDAVLQGTGLDAVLRGIGLESVPGVTDLANLVLNAELHITQISSDDAWSSVPYEQLWAASLSANAVCCNLENASEVEDLFTSSNISDFCKELVHIASRSTSFPIGTSSSVLEVALVNSLAPFQMGMDVLEDANDVDRPVLLSFLAQALDSGKAVPLSLTQAIYDFKGGNVADYLLEVRRIFHSRSVAPRMNQEIAFRAACLERLGQEKSLLHTNDVGRTKPLDFGRSRLPRVGDPLSDTRELEVARLDEDELTDEVSDHDNTMGRLDDNEHDRRPEDQFAASLYLQDTMLKKEKSKDAYRRRIASALAVIQARRLLAQLLARWPESVLLNAQQFGLDRYWELLNVIDTLRLTPECVQQVPRALSVMLERCPRGMLGQLTYVCCSFLKEGSHELERRTYSNAAKETIHFERASTIQLRVQRGGLFGTSISVQYDNMITGDHVTKPVSALTSDIVMNTNEFQLDIEPLGTLSGKTSFKIYGWNYRYFDTGYDTLRSLLDRMRGDKEIRRSVPIGHLWVWLLYECCRTTGTRRLRLIDLLTRLLIVLEMEDPCEYTKIDKRLAASLWKLLNDINTMYNNRKLNSYPETGRRLAQLFYVLERLALKRGEAGGLSYSMCDSRPAIRSYAHGCRIIASVCAEIGIENEVTGLLQSMATAYSAKAEGKEKEEEEEEVGTAGTRDLLIIPAGAEEDDDAEEEEEVSEMWSTEEESDDYSTGSTCS